MTLYPDLVHFILTVVLSFLMGLEIKTYRMQYHSDSAEYFFGSARTFTFVGILGFLFYKIDPERLLVYVAGLAGLTLMFAIFYNRKVATGGQSILLYLVMLVVYTMGPISQIYPFWMPALIFVLVVFILNAKRAIHRFVAGVNAYEFETLGKMVLLSAVVLPLLPDKKIIPYIPISPFKIWLAVVAISGISYGGYIVQKYFFPNKGYFLTGIIGGTYSSTATTVVLARKLKSIGYRPVIEAAIIAATSVMYLRLILVAAIFNFAVAKALFLPFMILSFAGLAVSAFFFRSGTDKKEEISYVDKNPLELGTALLFAVLFVIMMILTQYVAKEYGSAGLEILSFIVGFTDIDPFVLSLLTGRYGASTTELTALVMIAAGSNNLLKALYAIWFAGLNNGYKSALAIVLLGVSTIAYGLYL